MRAVHGDSDPRAIRRYHCVQQSPAVGHDTPCPKSMEKLRQTRSRADQEEHAPFYVQCEAIERTLQSERPCSYEFDVIMNREIEKVNSHVVACLGVLESASPASDNELVRCSSQCGILGTFIHCNRNALREIAKEFNEKMRDATWACRTRFSMQTIEAASFCTSLLERVLNVQARLEESVLSDHLRRLLTEVYEASAGLSESSDKSPSFRRAPKAPDAPRMPLMPISPRSTRPASVGPARAKRARSSSRPHRPRTTDLPAVEVPPPAVVDWRLRNQVAGPPLLIRTVDGA